MDSKTKENLTRILKDMSGAYDNVESEKRETMRKEMLDINNMILNDDKFEEEKRKVLKAESLREKEVNFQEKELGLREKEVSLREQELSLREKEVEENKRKSLKAESLQEQELSLREKEVSKSAEDDKKAKRDRLIDLGLKVAGIVIPASLYFAGMIMSMKLEYVDNGRTPGAFKDFIKKF